MSNELELAAIETFGGVECNFYKDDDRHFYMTRQQIGQALEYADPQNAIQHIHNRRPERFTLLSGWVNLSHPKGGTQKVVVYTLRGCMEICRLSDRPKADAFMDFVWDVMEKLYYGELELTVPRRDELDKIYDWINLVYKKINQIDKSLGYLNYYHRRQMCAHYDTKWMVLAKRKFKAIAKHLQADDKQVLRGVYIEMEDRFHIDLDEYQTDYNFVNNTNQSSRLDVIDSNPALRQMFDAVVDDLISRYKIMVSLDLPKRKTIFDVEEKEGII